jgi:hypothetical protein
LRKKKYEEEKRKKYTERGGGEKGMASDVSKNGCQQYARRKKGLCKRAKKAKRMDGYYPAA